MPKKSIKRVSEELTCKRCGHSWMPRLFEENGDVRLPIKCPDCGSWRWNYERLDNEPGRKPKVEP